MKTKIVAGVIVLLGLAWAGATWYTGKQAEEKVKEAVVAANAELYLYDMFSVDVGSLSYERGLFSSTGRYRVTISLAHNAAIKKEFEIAVTLDHGPFPWSRLKSGHWRPVSMVGQVTLIKTPNVQNWFLVTKGLAPLSIAYRVDYSGKISGTLGLAPFEYAFGDGGREGLKFSGMKNEFSYAASQYSYGMNVDSIALRLNDATQFTLQGLTLEDNGKAGKNGVYPLGLGRLQIKSLTTNPQKTGAIQIRDINLVTESTEADHKLDIHIALNVGGITVQDQDIAGMKLNLALKQLDVNALRVIEQAEKRIKMHAWKGNASEGDSVAFMRQQQALIEENTLALLNGKPIFSLSPLELRTPKGISTLDVNFAVQPAPKRELDPLSDNLSKLDFNLKLSKASLADLAAVKLRLYDGFSAEEVPTMSQAFVKTIEAMATAADVAKVDKDNITSSLNYADGRVDFNGEQMSSAEFFQRFSGLLE